jgi:transformation/transcription domain-associated protein
MSLLAFLLRNPNDALKSFKNVIPEYVVRLLKDCPPELSAARKVCHSVVVTDLDRNC